MPGRSSPFLDASTAPFAPLGPSRPEGGEGLTSDAHLPIVRRDASSVVPRGGSAVLQKMEALEAKIRDLVDLVRDLKRTNAMLQGEVRAVRTRIQQQEALGRRWAKDREDIRVRVQKVMAGLEHLESRDDSTKEVARD